jgi:ubiquinone/menaquinone biosynthesis C-methylase UbiE
MSKGNIIGIDIHQPYLDELEKKIKKNNLTDQVKTINMSMLSMDFPLEHFNIIWAEGSIFIIGFEKGLKEWKKFIKPKGYLAVHEMAWLKPDPPK